MNPRTCKSAAIALIAALGLSFAAAAADAQPPRLKLATLAPRGSIYHRVLMEMGDTWRRAEGPGATFTVFPDGSQGGEADIVRRMRIGQLNGAMASVVGLREIDNSVAALQLLPLMFRSWDEVDVAGARVRPMLEKRLLEKGYVVLFWGEGGWVRFFSKERAVQPEHYKRLKIFAWAGDPQQVALMKAIGYQPVVLETADILPGLQTGLINVVPVTATWALASQIDAVAPHMLDIRWVPIVGASVITRKSWEGLSPAGQHALKRAAAKAAETLRAQRADADREAVAAMKARGLQVHAVSREHEAEWRALAETLYPRIRDNMVPAEMFDAVQASVLEYRNNNVTARQ